MRLIRRVYMTVLRTLICDRCGIQSDWWYGCCPHCGCTEGHMDE